MALIVNTDIKNTTGYLVESKYIKGGYLVVDTYANLTDSEFFPANSIIEGSLCFCKEKSKFYQYNGESWIEPAFSSELVNFIKKEEISFASTEDIKALFK